MYSVYVPRTPLTLNQPPATIYNLGRFTASCYPEVIDIHDHDKIHELASICFFKVFLEKIQWPYILFGLIVQLKWVATQSQSIVIQQ